MENIIREAIANKQLLKFVYNDKKRVVEPYTFGCSHKGDDTLSAFQIEGGSNSSKDLGWRQFIIENIEKLVLLDSKFDDIREGYNPNDSRMSQIYMAI
jgi:predicted DNA-binding transcriptional regulator YafY